MRELAQMRVGEPAPTGRPTLAQSLRGARIMSRMRHIAGYGGLLGALLLSHASHVRPNTRTTRQ